MIASALCVNCAGAGELTVSPTTTPLLQDIESSHIADDAGALENPLGFSPAELTERRRELIDIAVVGHDTADKEYKPE